MSDPSLSADRRKKLVVELMAARRAVAAAGKASDRQAEDAAHGAVDAAKRALGERGRVWWDDGEPDYNRHMAKNTHYVDWFSALR